jgi:hypothetical protein
MAEHTVDNTPIVSGNLVLPRDGTWTADLVLQSDDATGFAVGQRVGVFVAGYKRVGTITRLGAPYNQVRLRVLGGAGKLDTILTPRDYRNHPVADVLRDALIDAGETPGVIDTTGVLPHWQRFAEPLWAVMARLRRMLPTLRVNAQGSWDARVETWSRNMQDVVYTGEYPAEGSAEVAPDTGDLEPGQTLFVGNADRRLDRIEYTIGTRLRALLYFAENKDRLYDAIADYQLANTLRAQAVDTRAFYPARVAKSAPNLVDLIADDARIGSKTGVPIRVNPGSEVKLAIGTRVLLGWVAGDLTQPMVLLGGLGLGGMVDETHAFTGVYTLAGPRIRLTTGGRGVARLHDTADAGTLTITSPASISVTYTPPDGAPAVYTVGAPIPLRAKIDSASAKVTADE